MPFPARPIFSAPRSAPVAGAQPAGDGAMARRRPAAPRIPGRRLLSLGPSARRIQGRAAEDAGAELGGVLGRGQARRVRRPAGRNGHQQAGAQDAHRQQDGRGDLFRHVRPVRGRAVFRRRSTQYRDLLEAGRSVVITVAAEDRPEGVNLRINSVQSLEDEASRIQKALRIFVCERCGPRRSPRRPAHRSEARGR